MRYQKLTRLFAYLSDLGTYFLPLFNSLRYFTQTMNLDEFARLILFGTRLEDKLYHPPDLDWTPRTHPSRTLILPELPGRPPELRQPKQRASFPSLRDLKISTERGKVLHFFANHELLALEIMALVLLRFPDAPEDFRRDIVLTLSEEQNHLKLYIKRMRELGVEFGDLPANYYFWDVMKNVSSPLDYTVQMSLTFEQANLDYSLFFLRAIRKTEDFKTTEILAKVFKDEIGHVKQGLGWFNQWRNKNESEWESYAHLLPSPLNPQRAKGYEFSEPARRSAGFSTDYIKNLKVYSGSKGRPPAIWWYNPLCEIEIARKIPGLTPSLEVQKRISDLEHFPMFLCSKQDCVLLNRTPSIEWLENLQASGFEIPEFIKREPSLKLTSPKICGIEPWGWSPDSHRLAQKLSPLLTTGPSSQYSRKLIQIQTFENSFLPPLFSKQLSVSFLKSWLLAHPETQSVFGPPELVGNAFSDLSSIRTEINRLVDLGLRVLLKAPYGTSGMQMKRIRKMSDLTESTTGWILNILKDQPCLIVETELNKLKDLSIQLEISDSQTKILPTRRFLTQAQFHYLGTCLGTRMPGFTKEELRFYHQAKDSWHLMLRDLGDELRTRGYRGPAGIDALLFRTSEDELRLKPLVELNPRWTMGRVALELEKHLVPGISALFLLVPISKIKSLGFSHSLEFSQHLMSKYPVEFSEQPKKMRKGILFTNDPKIAHSTLSILGTLPNPDLETILDHTVKSFQIDSLNLASSIKE